MSKINLPALVSAAISLSILTGCTNNNTLKSKGLTDKEHNILKQNQVNITSNKNFSDVPSGEWYAENVQWASSLGLVDGFPDGTFKPDKALTRAEVIKIIKSLADKGYITAGATTNAVSYAFTQAGDHPENVLVNIIGEAKQKLDIAIYSLTLPSVVQAILDAHNRGVAVRIISDKTEAATQSQSAALNQLAAAGIPIKINKHSGLMHLKVTIVDSNIFTTGSFNYSTAASTTNDEVLLVDRDAAGAAKWDEQFERMWNDTTGFVDFGNTSGSNPSAGTTPQPPNVYYASCAAVKAAGKALLHRGDPGYRAGLDRDGDGIACEQ